MDSLEAFTNLAIVANVDGEIAYYEKFLLDKYAAKLNLGPIVCKTIVDSVKSGEKKEFVKPKSPEARDKLYKAMVKVARSDGKITKKEQTLLRRLGNLLEIDPEKMESALEKGQSGS